MTEIEDNDIARARIRRCIKEASIDNAALFDAIRDCAVAVMAYETSFDQACAVICQAIGRGQQVATQLVPEGISFGEMVHDDYHAMAEGLVRKMINDCRNEIESALEDEHDDGGPSDGST